MAHSIELAIHHKHLYPSDSYKSVAGCFQVKKMTLYSRIKDTQSAHGVNTPQALSTEQERVLVEQISQYATRGTFLTLFQVHELAEVLAAQKLGLNWMGIMTATATTDQQMTRGTLRFTRGCFLFGF